ncbi:MFS transporter [Rhizocola hellebori]|uniref:MFS transporter n=1 Tax=Rhizocola hellebori TaxID=1392758 RepID=A0A8J3VJP1_9ACTN|nr:MFS transporter [Rhizocola hellebori]GIH08246.1 MFS transporter [Rhizocola hellebori]
MSDARRLITPAFVALTLSELAYFLAIGLMIPVVPLLASGPMAAGPVGVGVAVGIFSFTALVLRPFAGRLSDRLGSGRLFLIGGILFTLVIAAHLVVESYWALLIVRGALGVSDALFFVAGMAALADIAPPDRLGEALSYNSLALYLGIAFGPALGEWLLRAGNFDTAWLGALGLGCLATLFAAGVPRMKRVHAPAEPAPLIARQLIGPGLAFLAGLGGAAGFLAFATLYARDIGLNGAGTVLFVYGAVVVGCRLLFARLSDRYPAPLLSGWALINCALGLGLMSLTDTSNGLIAGAVVLGVGVTFLTPAFYREMMSRLPASQHGAAAATFSIFVDLGLGGGPILFGLIANPASIPAAFAIAAALAGLAGIAVLTSFRRAPKPG